MRRKGSSGWPVDLQLTANLVLWAFSVLLESFVVAQPNVLDGNASGIAGFRGDPQQGEICVVGGFDLLDGQTWVFRVKAVCRACTLACLPHFPCKTFQ